MPKKIFLLLVFLSIIYINCDSIVPIDEVLNIEVANAEGDFRTGYTIDYISGPLVITATSSANKFIAMQMKIDQNRSDIKTWAEMQISWDVTPQNEFMCKSNVAKAMITGSGKSTMAAGVYRIVVKIIATTGIKEVETSLVIILKVAEVVISDFTLSRDEIFKDAEIVIARYKVFNYKEVDAQILNASLAFTSEGGTFDDLSAQFDLINLINTPRTITPGSNILFEFQIKTTPGTQPSSFITVTPVIQTSLKQIIGSEKNFKARIWQQITDFPINFGGLSGAVAGILNNSLYCLGGITSVNPVRMNDTNWKLNISGASSNWVARGTLGSAAVYQPGVAWTSDAIYLVGGMFQTGDDMQVYNGIQKYNGDTTEDVGTLKVSRAGAAVIYANDCLYICGGYDENDEAIKTVEKFDLGTGACDIIGEIDQETCLFSGFQLDDRLFLLGGSEEPPFVSPDVKGTNGIFYSAGDANNWLRYTAAELFCHTTAYTFGYESEVCWLAGGFTNWGTVQDCLQRFNPNTNFARRVGSTPTQIFNSAGLILNGYLYLLGGQILKNVHVLSKKCYRLNVD